MLGRRGLRVAWFKAQRPLYQFWRYCSKKGILKTGVGLASYAGEKSRWKIGELRSQAQKLADEMVAQGVDTELNFKSDLIETTALDAEPATVAPTEPRPD